MFSCRIQFSLQNKTENYNLTAILDEFEEVLSLQITKYMRYFIFKT